ncbi:MAG: hypothetical protein N2508_07265 [Anaerolineae bacterium]|nr:hypothetical protein [Anaerolineae bacterium]
MAENERELRILETLAQEPATSLTIPSGVTVLLSFARVRSGGMRFVIQWPMGKEGR